jgi:hypothetical protein
MNSHSVRSSWRVAAMLPSDAAMSLHHCLAERHRLIRRDESPLAVVPLALVDLESIRVIISDVNRRTASANSTLQAQTDSLRQGHGKLFPLASLPLGMTKFSY